jgi:plasmid stability protein
MKLHAKQYTIRNVPESVDRALRRRARETGRSFNRVALDALAEGTGEAGKIHDDLDFMIGSMSSAEARAIGREIAAQRRIDRSLWK